VPQSELQLFNGGHELVFRQAEMLVPVLDSFIQKVEKGEARTLAHADAERVARAHEHFDPATIPKPQGLALAVLLFLLAIATLVSEDLTCISAGLLVARGTMNFVPAALACRRERIDDGRIWLGRILPVEFRTDGRFLLRTYRAVRESRAGT
jgi:hypothetical protein